MRVRAARSRKQDRQPDSADDDRRRRERQRSRIDESLDALPAMQATQARIERGKCGLEGRAPPLASLGRPSFGVGVRPDEPLDARRARKCLCLPRREEDEGAERKQEEGDTAGAQTPRPREQRAPRLGVPTGHCHRLSAAVLARHRDLDLLPGPGGGRVRDTPGPVELGADLLVDARERARRRARVERPAGAVRKPLERRAARVAQRDRVDDDVGAMHGTDRLVERREAPHVAAVGQEDEHAAGQRLRAQLGG